MQCCLARSERRLGCRPSCGRYRSADRANVSISFTDANSPNWLRRKRPRITLTHYAGAPQRFNLSGLTRPAANNQRSGAAASCCSNCEFGMNPQEASKPRFDTQHYVSSFDDHEFLPGVLNMNRVFSGKDYRGSCNSAVTSQSPPRGAHFRRQQ